VVGVSGASPFAPGGTYDCGRHDGNTHWEFEPTLAANPLNQRELVAAWVQDDYLGIVAAFSTDGGATWVAKAVPGLTSCADGDFGAAVHVRAAYALDGTAYLAVALQKAPCTGPDPECLVGRIALIRSSDRGTTWQGPVYVATEEGVNHLDNVVADPADPRSVFVMWAKRASPDVTFISHVTGTLVTTHLVQLNQPGRFGFSNFVAFQRDGKTVLVDVFQEFSFTEAGPIMVTRSLDGGRSWSVPQKLGESESLQFPDIAIAPDQTLYATWHIPSGTGRELMISMSHDAGITWRTVSKLQLAQGGTLPAPSLVAARDGSITLVYDDNRNDQIGDAEVTVDTWFARSSDGGITWDEVHVAGSFDHASVPHHDESGSDGGLGYYQETVALPCSIASSLVLGRPAAVLGPSDVFFANIKLPASGPCRP